MQGVVDRGYGLQIVHTQKVDPVYRCMVPYAKVVAVKPPEERSACGQRKLIKKQRRKAEKAEQTRLRLDYEDEYGPAALVRRAAEVATNCAHSQVVKAWRSQVVPQQAIASAPPMQRWVDKYGRAHVSSHELAM